jgi:hypothetical protein
MEKELGYKLDMPEVKEKLKGNFEKVFAAELLEEARVGQESEE